MSTKELVERLRITSNMVNMGEKISWGQDTALMDEAANTIERLERERDEARKGHVSRSNMYGKWGRPMRAALGALILDRRHWALKAIAIIAVVAGFGQNPEVARAGVGVEKYLQSDAEFSSVPHGILKRIEILNPTPNEQNTTFVPCIIRVNTNDEPGYVFCDLLRTKSRLLNTLGVCGRKVEVHRHRIKNVVVYVPPNPSGGGLPGVLPIDANPNVVIGRSGALDVFCSDIINHDIRTKLTLPKLSVVFDGGLRLVERAQKGKKGKAADGKSAYRRHEHPLRPLSHRLLSGQVILAALGLAGGFYYLLYALLHVRRMGGDAFTLYSIFGVAGILLGIVLGAAGIMGV